MFGLRRHTDWNFVQFFTVIMHTVLLYMLSANLVTCPTMSSKIGSRNPLS